jgi:hypothetical protein
MQQLRPNKTLERISKPVAEDANLPRRRNSCEFRYGESVLKCPLADFMAEGRVIALGHPGGFSS